MDHQHIKFRRSDGGSGGGGCGGGGGGQKHGPPGPPTAQICPRCNSSNTKFCYYNNYSLTQPRYFCKGCRRYWTHGGTLRNVPVGGGCRKSKRPKVGPSTSAPPSQHPPPGFPPGPTGVREGNDAALFMSSLNFGSNMGLLHGFELPNLQPNNSPMFQNVYTYREIGSSSSSVPPATGDWSLSMVPPGVPPPPLPLPETNNNVNNSSTNNDDNNNNNDDNNQSNQWAEYMGNSGIEEP